MRRRPKHRGTVLLPRKELSGLHIALFGLAGVLLASLIAAGSAVYINFRDGDLQKDIIEIQHTHSEVTAHNEFSRAQRFATYARAQLAIGNFAKAGLACIEAFGRGEDAFSPDLRKREAAVAFVKSQVLTPLAAATNGLVDVRGSMDIIASDKVRKLFDEIQEQTQTYNNKCREILNIVVNAGPGGNPTVPLDTAKELHALIEQFNNEFPQLTVDMRADLALK
jgi:hypothetical protein